MSDEKKRGKVVESSDSMSPNNLDDILNEEQATDNSDEKPSYQNRTGSVDRKKRRPQGQHQKLPAQETYQRRTNSARGRSKNSTRTNREYIENGQDMEEDFNENNKQESYDDDDFDEDYPLTLEQQQQHRQIHQQLSKVNQLQKQKTGGNRPKTPRSNLKSSPSVSIVENNSNGLGEYKASGYEIDKKGEEFDIWVALLVLLSYAFLIATFPFSLCACVKIAQEYERSVIFRIGRILPGGTKGPGIFFILPCIDNYIKVDLRTVTFDVPPQEILTRDSVTVSVDAVVYFRIFNATISVINVEDAAKSTKLLAASTLRNILGTKSLHEILSDRESVAISIQGTLDDATGPCKDVRLPVQLQRAMATEAEAAREARAKVIAAEGEQNASSALRKAAEVISESPIAIQLRYLQTLTQIASEKNSTIVFPVPLEMLSFLANKSTPTPGGGGKNAQKKAEATSAIEKF